MAKNVLAVIALLFFSRASGEAGEARGFRIELENKVSSERGFMFLNDYRVTSLVPGQRWWYEVRDGETSPFDGGPPRGARFVMCTKVDFRFAYPPRWAMNAAIVGNQAVTDRFFDGIPMPFELAVKRANIIRYLKSKGRSDRDLALMAYELREWVLKNELLTPDCGDPIELSVALDWQAASKRRVSIVGSRKDGYRLEVR